MSVQPMLDARIDIRSVNWPVYFEQVLPRSRPLRPADLHALGYREVWKYELIETVLICTPWDEDDVLTFHDLEHAPEDPHWVFELVEGMLIVSPNAPSLRHQRCAASLYLRLRDACPAESETVIAPFEYVSAAPITVQPDVLVARRPIGAKRLEHTPELVVEVVSKGTELRDLGIKKIVYERAGVPHVWLVYPEQPLIRAIRLVDGEYREWLRAEAGQVFAVEEPVRVSFTVADLID